MQTNPAVFYETRCVLPSSIHSSIILLFWHQIQWRNSDAVRLN